MLASRKATGRSAPSRRFCEHVDLRLVNKRVVESLVKAGALDSLRRLGRELGDATRHRAPGPALRGHRSRARSRQPPPGRPRAGPVAPVRRRRRRRRRCAAGARCRTAVVGRGDAARREGSARSLLERSSARAPCRGPKAAGALTQRRRWRRSRAAATAPWPASLRGCRIVKTRKGDRMAVFMLEDQDRQRRGRGLSRAVQAVRVVHRERPHGGGHAAASKSTRNGPRCGRPRSRISRR